MKIKLLILTLILSVSTSAFADLIYDAGTAPSHGPEGAEVDLQDAPAEGAGAGKAEQVGKDKVVIEKPYEYDANDVPAKPQPAVSKD